MKNVFITKLEHGTNVPFYATPDSAGVDLPASIKEAITLMPGKRTLIPTGLKIALPEGHEAQVRSRSGLALKHGIMTLNSPGTIDADYRGEICVILMNLGDEPFVIEPGMRIAQMVITTYVKACFVETDTLPDSVRGEGGFGSTGA